MRMRMNMWSALCVCLCVWCPSAYWCNGLLFRLQSLSSWGRVFASSQSSSSLLGSFLLHSVTVFFAFSCVCDSMCAFNFACACVSTNTGRIHKTNFASDRGCFSWGPSLALLLILHNFNESPLWSTSKVISASCRPNPLSFCLLVMNWVGKWCNQTSFPSRHPFIPTSDTHLTQRTNTGRERGHKLHLVQVFLNVSLSLCVCVCVSTACDRV